MGASGTTRQHTPTTVSNRAMPLHLTDSTVSRMNLVQRTFCQSDGKYFPLAVTFRSVIFRRTATLLAFISIGCVACGGASNDSSSVDTAAVESTSTTPTTPPTTQPAVPQTTAVPLTNVVPADVPLPNVTCADVEPPKNLRIAESANAHVSWTFVMAPPPETSPNQLNLEVSADNGSTWKRAPFMRISLTSALLTDTTPGATLMVRAQLYRANKNPCITEYSNSIELTIK